MYLVQLHDEDEEQIGCVPLIRICPCKNISRLLSFSIFLAIRIFAGVVSFLTKCQVLILRHKMLRKDTLNLSREAEHF